ncbi:lysozyme-like domain-containing protein [Obelidium mucronatum]|nr:lysozyme-like domain-containing protein [Obelidium mucronatum]
MLRLTSYFETSKTDLGFAECSTTADGQGISAGFIQFTTCSGSALTVCETYEGLAKSNGKSTFCKKYLVPLRRTVGSCIFGGKEAITPPGLENFCKDWRAAAKDPLFQEAQQRIQFSSYFENLTPHFVNYNIKFPLTIAQMYDTSVQLGPGSIEKIANRATELSGGMPGKVDESWWLLNFFTARSEEWDRLGGAYPGTKYRVDAYRSMLTDKNWYFNFAKELKFTCWNTPTTLSCANKCNT